MGECQLALGSCETIGDFEFDEGLEVVRSQGTDDGPPITDAEGGVGGVFADVDYRAGANHLLNVIAGNEIIGSVCGSSCREGSGQSSEDSHGRGEDSRLHFDDWFGLVCLDWKLGIKRSGRLRRLREEECSFVVLLRDVREDGFFQIVGS